MSPAVAFAVHLLMFTMVAFLTVAAVSQPPSPAIDLSRASSVAFTGRFDALSLTTSPFSPSGKESVLLKRTPTSVDVLSVLNENVTVKASCFMDGMLYVGGVFPRIGDVDGTSHVAGWMNGTWKALNRGLDGPVRSLLCDNATNTVYAVGSFRGPMPPKDASRYAFFGTFGGGIAAWRNNTWVPLAGKGVDATSMPPITRVGPDGAPLREVVAGGHDSVIWPDMERIVVVGAFRGTADGPWEIPPDSQPVNLGLVRFTSSISTTNTAGLVCGTEDWLLPSNTTGSVTVTFPTALVPMLLRLRNPKTANRGTKTFRARYSSASAPISLMYWDDTPMMWRSCSDACPMKPSGEDQDFRVIPAVEFTGNGTQSPNARVSSVVLEVMEWYGDGGGLSSVAVFQRDVIAFADARFNGVASCLPAPQSIATSATSGSGWSLVNVTTTPISRNVWLYSGTGDGKVSFSPNVPEDGWYEVWVDEPSCTSTNTCDRPRTDVKVNITTDSLLSVAQATLPANQQGLPSATSTKVFTGRMEAPKGDFRVSIVLMPQSGANGTTLVVDAVRLVRVGMQLDGLNGALSWPRAVNAQNATISTLYPAVEDGANGLPVGSIVRSVAVTKSDTLTLAGRFRRVTSNNRFLFQNVVQVTKDGKLVPVPGLPGGGVSGGVIPLSNTDLDQPGDVFSVAADGIGGIFLGGDFNRTSDRGQRLGHLISISKSGSVDIMGGGVDAPVTRLVPIPSSSPALSFSTGNTGNTGNSSFPVMTADGTNADVDGSARIHVIGMFNKLLASDAPTMVQQYAVWDAKKKAWVSGPYVRGTVDSVSTAVDTDSKSYAEYISGTFTSFEAATSPRVIGMSSPYEFVTAGFELANALSTNGSLIRSSGFYNESTSNASAPLVVQVVGGVFSDENSKIKNAARFDSMNGWRPIPGKDFDGDVNVVSVVDEVNMVYFGGAFSNGLAAWNTQSSSFDTSFGIASAPANVSVNAMVQKADKTLLIVGGTFANVANVVDCVNICAWDWKAKSWKGFNKGVGGVIRDMTVADDKIAVIGDGIGPVEGTPGAICFGVYTFSKNEWAFIGSQTECPSTPASISADPENGSVVVAGTTPSGESFIVRWDGSKLTRFGKELGTKSVIAGVSVVPVTVDGPKDNALFSERNMLVASGSIVLPNAKGLAQDRNSGQTVNAAFFDGVNWYPFARISPNDPSGGGGLVPLVVLVAAAISLGIIFVIAAIIFFVVRRRRRKRAGTAIPPLFEKAPRPASPALPPIVAPIPVHSRGGQDMRRLPPMYPVAPSPIASPEHVASPKSVISSDLDYAPVPLMQALDAQFQLADYDVYYAKFPFNAGETGELEFATGDKIYVLDNSDDVWWLGLVENGPNVPPSQGVFPASYVSKEPPPRWNPL